MWRISLVALTCFVCIVACERPDVAPADLPAVVYKDSTIVMRNDDCKIETGDATCCIVEITIPVFSGGAPGTADSLNRRVRGFFVSLLGSNLPSDSSMPDIIEASRALMQEFEEFQADFPMSSAGWEVRGSAKVLTVDSLICVALDAYNYLGGAHAMTILEYDVARAASGDTVNVIDIVRDRQAFTRQAEMAFRQAVSMKADDDDYASQGYWFKNNEFKLPDNIGLTPDSVLFQYNVYEIAPYSMGTVQFSLPRTSLQ
jgi:hypothetical protein